MLPTTTRPLSAIAAIAENRVIGCANKLPWHLPEDFKFFKQTTLGHILIMGRKTFESIGKILPGRTTVVLTRNGLPNAPAGIHVTDSWAEIQNLEPSKKLFIAGGASLYAQTLPWCDELLLTHVHASPPGDTFFPPYEKWFDSGEILVETPQFTIRRHRRQ
jgi:dihydrofolate reductase